MIGTRYFIIHLDDDILFSSIYLRLPCSQRAQITMENIKALIDHSKDPQRSTKINDNKVV
jgi:hypothetical protein